MHRWKTIAATATAAVVGAGVVLIPASPASAAITTSVSGTTITVTATGDATVTFDCSGSGGNVLVSTDLTSPTIACTALTKVTVNGDGGVQRVYGQDLLSTFFTAQPNLVATTADGADVVITPGRNDIINTGLGADYLSFPLGGPSINTLQLGGDEDFVQAYATSGNDTISVTSGSANAAINWSNGTTSAVYQLQNSELLRFYGRPGNDSFTDTAITGGSTITRFDAFGEEGNDTFTSGTVTANLGGGPGTNTFNGGSAQDVVDSNSDTDVIHLGAGPNYIYDRDGTRFGDRDIDSTSTTNGFSATVDKGDATFRVRPAASVSDSALLTASLNRPGQQLLPGGFNNINVDLGGYSNPEDRGLFDVVTPSKDMNVSGYGDPSDTDLADITIPTGTWSTNGTAATTLNINPDGGSGYASVSVGNMGAVSIHNTWTNKNQGFAHRVTRDLLFRFPTAVARDQIRDQLAAGTTTRAQVTQSLMATDEYRGLDVDRTFVRFLRRTADPGGRTYWINSIRNGKALWRFRAQLFGSNEYFTKAGGTNAQYMVKAYSDVLGRAPDPSGQTYWTNKLQNGANRGSVALQFINSPEARRRLVDDQFLRFLDRLPTSGESTTWTAQMSNAGGEQALIAFLAASAGYYNRT